MALRNSLLKTRAFNNEKIAEEQVINVIDFDVHMEKDIYGNRFIERITECIVSGNSYMANDIVVFENNKYCIKNQISDKRIICMKKEMTKEDEKSFSDFLEREMNNV